VEEGLRLLDEVGLRGFSMRLLADRLDTYPTTLYWHVGDRGRLLAAILSRVLRDVELPGGDALGWQERLRTIAKGYRSALHRHPNVGSLVASELTVSVPSFGLSEAILAALERAGFAGTALLHAYNAYVGSLVGWVSVELSADPARHDPGWRDEFAAALRGLGPDEHPTLAANLDDLADAAFGLRWHGGAERPLDESFDFALGTWVAGLEARLASAPS
jgi:AcrR family transcriptional regulator